MDIEGARKVPVTQMPRSRLLLSCGESAQAVARRAYQRVEAMRCPVGCVARGLSRAAAPVLAPLQLRCLSALGFVDRQLTVAQDVAAVLFPPCERVLSKVDRLVLLVESLPATLDGAIDGLEALVAGATSGIWGLVSPRRYCYRADVFFRDIRCDEEDPEGALLRQRVPAAAGDEAATRAMEKRCQDVTRKVESVEVVTVHGGGDGGTERAVVRGANEKAARPEKEEQEDRHEDTAAALKGGESKDEAAQAMRRDVATGGVGEGGEGPKQDGATAATVEAAEIMEATQSGETAKVESQEEVGSSEREEAISMGGKVSKEDAFLDFFEAAWQQKLA